MKRFLREVRMVDYSLRTAKILTAMWGALLAVNMLLVSVTVLTADWMLSATTGGTLTINAMMFRYVQMKRGRAERDEWIRKMEAAWGRRPFC